MRTYLLLLGVFVFTFSAGAQRPTLPTVSKLNPQNGFSFIENKGQWGDTLLYRATTKDGACQLLPDRISFAFLAPLDENEEAEGEEEEEIKNNGGIVWNLLFEGMRGDCRLAQLDFIPGEYNYFLGNDASKWGIGCLQSRAVIYRNAWNGIHAKVYGTAENKAEYDFILEPGADISDIRLRIDGPLKLWISKAGELCMESKLGLMKKSAPLAYQEINGKRVFVNVSYKLVNNHLFFEAEAYDKSSGLIIDPVVWSTWVCGPSDDCYVYDVATDDALNAYITGFCSSASWPVTPGNYSTYISSSDVFMAKINNTGTDLIFSSIFGGSNTDIGNCIKTFQGDIYVSGLTRSGNMPISAGAFQPLSKGLNDGFVLKLDETGKKMIGSTYLGGSSADQIRSIYIVNGETYVGGWTSSMDFPATTGAYKSLKSTTDQDGFIGHFNKDFTTLLACTFIGGLSTDWVYSLSGEGSALYATGWTVSTDFPTTPGAFQRSLNGKIRGNDTGTLDIFLHALQNGLEIQSF